MEERRPEAPDDGRANFLDKVFSAGLLTRSDHHNVPTIKEKSCLYFSLREINFLAYGTLSSWLKPLLPQNGDLSIQHSTQSG